MFFTFPEDARLNAERQAVEFGVEIGDYRGCGPGAAARVPAAAPGATYPRAVRRGAITSSGPASRASPSESSAGAS
jgi:hypothetical protein